MPLKPFTFITSFTGSNYKAQRSSLSRKQGSDEEPRTALAPRFIPILDLPKLAKK